MTKAHYSQLEANAWHLVSLITRAFPSSWALFEHDRHGVRCLGMFDVENGNHLEINPAGSTVWVINPAFTSLSLNFSKLSHKSIASCIKWLGEKLNQEEMPLGTLNNVSLCSELISKMIENARYFDMVIGADANYVESDEGNFERFGDHSAGLDFGPFFEQNNSEALKKFVYSSDLWRLGPYTDREDTTSREDCLPVFNIRLHSGEISSHGIGAPVRDLLSDFDNLDQLAYSLLQIEKFG